MRYDLSKGFCVAGSDTESFLREKLTYMGLTEEEMNEFIVYWLPRMEHNRFNLISFQSGPIQIQQSWISLRPLTACCVYSWSMFPLKKQRISSRSSLRHSREKALLSLNGTAVRSSRKHSSTKKDVRAKNSYIFFLNIMTSANVPRPSIYMPDRLIAFIEQTFIIIR